MSEMYLRNMLVRVWPGVRDGKHYYAHVISYGVVKFGGVDCVRVRKMSGGTDYIALTHVEPVP